MNKKIVVIGILGMFLLMSVPTLSAVGMKAEVLGQSSIMKQVVAGNNELPDFIVEPLSYSIPAPPWKGYIVVEVGISNIGTSVEEQIIVDVKLTLDSDEITTGFLYTGTGTSETKEILMECDEGTTPHILTAIVDPPYEGHPYGDIEESDETNNIKSINVKSSQISQQSTQSQPSIQQSSTPLFFQILQRLMNIR